jgi:biopolymer transport protein ExbD
MRRKRRERIYFEVIPLIDIMMVLVLFFSIVAFLPHSKNIIKTSLPKSENNQKLEDDNNAYIVSIDKNQVIRFNNKILSINELKDILKSRKYINKTILLAADKELQYQKVINFLDILKENGNENVGLLTE